MVSRQQARREASEDNLPHSEEVEGELGYLLLTEGYLALLEEAVVVYRLSNQHNTASPATRVWDTSEDSLPHLEEDLSLTHLSGDNPPHSQAVGVSRRLLVVVTSEDSLPLSEDNHLSLTLLSEDILPLSHTHRNSVEHLRRW